MPEIAIPLGLQADQGRDTALNSSRVVNGYAEEVGGSIAVVACDGFAAFATMIGAAAGQIRGMITLDDSYLYAVTGTRLQSVTPVGGVTHMAEISTSGHAYFARNRRGNDGIGNPQVALVTSDGVFRIIENNVVATPSLDEDIPSNLFNSVCHLDGYFVITMSNGEFYISAIDDGTDIDLLDFASALANPDGLSRGLVRGRELVLFGPRSVEFWQNTGATDFPFERGQTAEMGVYAPAAAVSVMADIDGSIADTIFWPATNRDGAYIGVMMLAGYDGRKISTPEVDRAITGDASPASIRGFQYSRDDGTTFYVITGDAFSYEFNCRTKLWHKRESDGLTRWRISDAVQFNGRTVFGDYSSAALYARSSSITPGSASVVSLRHSDDHGDTWTTARTQTIGTSAQRTQRAKFNRLGMSREDGRVFELAITNAVIEAGTSNAMTVTTPAVGAYPNRMIFDTLYVDMIPGGSLSSRSKGIKQAKAIVRLAKG